MFDHTTYVYRNNGRFDIIVEYSVDGPDRSVGYYGGVELTGRVWSERTMRPTRVVLTGAEIDRITDEIWAAPRD